MSQDVRVTSYSPRPCETCHQDFVPKRASIVTCSELCRAKREREL